MATEIAYKVSVETGEGGKSLKSLKQDFKEAQKELDGLEQGTLQYVKALEKLGAIRDNIGDLNAEINAFNPEGKVKAFGSVVSGLASGFQAAQGAAALFGGENKNVEKALLKVQGAMAFSEGIKGLTGLKDSFTVLGNVIKANPIMLIATVVIGIGVALYALKDKIGVVGKAFTAIGDAIGWVTGKVKEFTDWIGISTFKMDELTDSTIKSNEKIKKLTSERYDKEIAAAKRAGEETETIEESKLAAIIRTNNVLIAQIKSRGELSEEDKKRVDELVKENADSVAKISDLSDKYRDDQEAKNEEAYKKQKAINDKKLTDNLALQKKLADEALAQQKKNDADELAATTSLIDKVKALKEAEDLRLAGSEQAKLQIQKDKDIAAIQAEYAKSNLSAAAQKAKNDALFLIDQKYLSDVNDANKASNEKKLADDKITADKKIALEKKKEEDIVKIIQDGLDSAQALADIAFVFRLNSVKKGSKEEEKIAKQQFEVNKALQIANTVVNTIVGVRNALIPKPAESPLEMGLRIANAVSIGIGGVAAIAKISATKFGATGGNVGGLNGGGGGGGGATAPSIAPPSNGSTMLNPDGSVKAPTIQQPVIKAVVVETDITKTQRNINSIETSAKL